MDGHSGFIAQNLIGKRVFRISFLEAKDIGLRHWIAMQVVGLVVMAIGHITVEPFIAEHD